MNTAEKIESLHDCSCGRFYPSLEAVSACQYNNHGSGKDKLGDRYKFRQTVETEYDIQCAECGTKLRFRLIEVSGSRSTIDVLPHMCVVDHEGR